MISISRPLLVCLTAAAFLAQSESASAQQIYISEFLADNQTNAKVDEDGDHSDWIEIWNATASAVSLNGWYLTDDSGDLRAWRFPVTTPAVSLAAGARILIFASNKDRKLDATKLHTNFRLAKNAGSYLALVRPDGLTIEHHYNSYPQQVQDVAYGLVVATQLQTLVPEGTMGKAKVPLSVADMPTTAPGWHRVGFDDNTWQSGQTGFGYDTAGLYGSLIGPGGDLQTAMHLVNSSALVRIPFNVTDPASIVSLRLSMKYDDGFNCYLNGNLIQQSFAGGTAWNSAAILDRNGALTASYQVFTPANAQQWLVAGTNILAFQILNFTNGSTQDKDDQGNDNGSRTLCLPILEANVATGVGTSAYLTSPTPGTVNSAPLGTLGPSISQTTELPPRPVGGAGSAPIIMTAKVVPSLKPLNANNPVTLRYRVMYGSESVIVMKDDGVAPDVVAGDTIYTASMPTTAVAAGQMIRWRVVATDNANASSANPPFRDAADNDQYFGTVALDGITTSQLPVLHWFVADGAASRTDGGTRCSLFYLGRFYDNVFVGLHGQSSSGFPVDKKSHDFNFNEDNRFTWKEGEIRQRAVNLITTWADKARVRDTMAWESWALSGHIAAHWANLVRVQQNAAFWGVYDMVENGDEDFPARAGLDPDGALYKVYNSLQDVSGVEKKSRDGDPSTADLQALETALNPTNPLSIRRQNAYDMVDVPSLANYLATNVIILNNDFGHKNYYVYRDTNGTREWSVLPWDQDLSIGHTWTSSQAYFNDDIHSQAGLVLGAVPGPGTGPGNNGNRLMNLMMNDGGNSGTIAPEMSRMFLRRIRTLMDKLYISAANTNGAFEQRINQLVDLIDPPGAAYITDGDLDLRKWGYWTDGSGAALSPNNTFDAATHDHGVRKQALRILNSNPNPPNPGAVSNAEGLGNTTFPFLIGRRSLLFNGNPQVNGQSIPTSQPAVPTGLIIEYVEANPGSANQTQEFFIIRNNSAIYVDVSGWKITGAIDYTFRGGTVIPPFTSGSAVSATGDVHTGRLHVARDPYQFRVRTTGPKGGQYRLVVGPYSGQLSARGETINLVIPGATPAQDVIVATNTYAAAPTDAQSFLRVTELNFNPVAPTAIELAALPGVQGRDFEFLELKNTGASPLSLANASFTKGISFTFPPGFTLQAGERCVVVSLLAAYNLRYGGAGAIVAGQFEGNLDNSGETVQLLDPVGESILEFTYDPLWFGVPKSGDPATLDAPQGYSFVTQSSSPAWDAYENPATWALSDTAGASPGTGETTYSNVFISWRRSHFTPSEEANTAISAPAADADLDGRTNFEEFVFGGNPRAFESKPQPAAVIVNENGTDYPAITFDRRHSAVDTTYTVEVATDLGTWAPANFPMGAPVDLGNGMERVTYRDSQPLNGSQRCLRVRATR